MTDNGTATAAPTGSSTVKAWDVPTRLFHWLLVAALASSWISFRYAEQLGDPTLKWHRYNGYAVLVLIVFRVLWGLWGSRSARWRTFVTSPLSVMRYAIKFITGRPTPHYLGHNPLGTYMILALMFAVGLQATVGLFVTEHNDTTWGPLYRFASGQTGKTVAFIHENLFYYALLPLIGAHIAANILYSLIKKDPLIKAMVVGTKPHATYADVSDVPMVMSNPWLRAILTIFLALAIVFGSIIALGGKILY